MFTHSTTCLHKRHSYQKPSGIKSKRKFSILIKNVVHKKIYFTVDFDFWCFNATFSNISAISWRPVLVVEEAGVPGENHQPWASNW